MFVIYSLEKSGRFSLVRALDYAKMTVELKKLEDSCKWWAGMHRKDRTLE